MIDSILIFFVLLPASISDLACYKIPNTVILNGLFLSLLFRCCAGGIPEVMLWCTGIIVPLLIGFIFYLFRAFGASDIKLLSVVGSFYGIQTCFRVILYALFAGGILAVLLLLKRNELSKRFWRLYSYILQVIICRKLLPYDRDEAKKAGAVLPFAICISLGVFFARFFGGPL